MKKIEYHYGQVLNKDTGSIFLYEIPTEKGKARRAKIKCGWCGKVYEAPVKKVKQGHVCRECSHKRTSLTRMSKYHVGMTLNKKTGTTLVKILDERGNYGEVKIITKCGYCHREYKTSLYKVTAEGHYCPFCRAERASQTRTKYREGDLFETNVGTFFYFDKEVQTDNHKRRGFFTPSDKNGKRLGKSFAATLTAVLTGKANGSGWSYAEQKTQDCLLDLPYNFQWQYTFQDLSGEKKHLLKFDFAVFYNNKICLIELDGEQHFKPVERFGGQDAFEKRQRYDMFKNQYVAQHDNLYLVRIGYKKFKKITSELLKSMIEGEEDVFYG